MSDRSRFFVKAAFAVARLIAVWLQLVVIATAMVSVYLNEPVF